MKESIYKRLADTNNFEYNITKAAEEFNELATVLLQFHNKPNKVDIKDITDEMGDCVIRLKILHNLFDKEEIKKRIVFKTGKFEKYLEKGKYKGKI